MVDSLVHRLVRRSSGVFPHRQLFRMVLSAERSTSNSALRATCGGDKHIRSHGDSAAALSPVRAAFLRFRQLQRDRRQDDRREARHLRNLSADPQADDAGTSVENLEKTRPLDEDHRTELQC